MITVPATTHIASVTPSEVERYGRYLTSIIPQNADEEFRRWLFAYASVHTTWRVNCKLYRKLKDMTWLHNSQALQQCIVEAGAGMHNKRTVYISSFADFFYKHPMWFQKSLHEDWSEYRNRLMEVTPGIGQAKASFWVEMRYPLESQVICVDTHILQLYGFSPTMIQKHHVRKREMDEIEQHWAKTCVDHKIPPVVARWVYWDKKQNQTDSRYWSYVFEENYHERFSKFIGEG